MRICIWCSEEGPKLEIHLGINSFYSYLLSYYTREEHQKMSIYKKEETKN